MEKKKAQIAADNIVKQFDDERGDYTPPITTFQLKQLLIKSYNAATLKWKKIDPDNLPKDEEEVIFIYKGFCQMGYFSAIHESNMFTTTSGICADIIDVTYYIPISDLLLLDKED